MAPKSLLPFFLFLLLSTLSMLVASSSSNPYLLPVIKDTAKLQYYTTFHVGTPSPVRINTVIDTGNLYSWFTCELVGYTHSSSYSVVPCGSPLCTAYNNGGSDGCIGCNGQRRPSCNNSCGAIAYTPWSNALYAGGLIGDVITLFQRLPVGKSSVLSPVSLPRFPFTCADAGPLKGISGHTKGVVTLARTPASLPAHVSATLKVPRMFALCIPSSSATGHKGAIYFGGGPYVLPPSSRDMAKYLVTTRLVVNPYSTAPSYSPGQASIEYYISLRSIKINGKSLRFNHSLLAFDDKGNGGTKISTLTPYTKLHPEIYKRFVDLFVEKAEAMGIARVAPVAPFGACFDSRTIHYNERRGRGVPIVDLIMHEKSPVLRNKKARWRFVGSNSMVKVSKGVQCLAFLKGGPEPLTSIETPIVIGGYQMQDNLIEFDLESSKLGVTYSLLRFGTSCFQL